MQPQRYDKAAIMRRAHKDFAHWKRAGAPRSFARCLSTAWAVAKFAEQHHLKLAA